MNPYGVETLDLMFRERMVSPRFQWRHLEAALNLQSVLLTKKFAAEGGATIDFSTWWWSHYVVAAEECLGSGTLLEEVVRFGASGIAPSDGLAQYTKLLAETAAVRSKFSGSAYLALEDRWTRWEKERMFTLPNKLRFNIGNTHRTFSPLSKWVVGASTKTTGKDTTFTEWLSWCRQCAHELCVIGWAAAPDDIPDHPVQTLKDIPVGETVMRVRVSLAEQFADFLLKRLEDEKELPIRSELLWNAHHLNLCIAYSGFADRDRKTNPTATLDLLNDCVSELGQARRVFASLRRIITPSV